MSSINNETKANVTEQAKILFAQSGYEGFTMRTLARKLSIAQSVLYHYFKSKDDLLLSVFENTRRDLGLKRKKVPLTNILFDNLKNRINFQFDNAKEITFILKYYLHFRENFSQNTQGYVPKTAYTHIYEVLELAQTQKAINITDLHSEAKVITHAINGFVLEYYPNIPEGSAREKVVSELTNFIYRSLIYTREGVNEHGRI